MHTPVSVFIFSRFLPLPQLRIILIFPALPTYPRHSPRLSRLPPHFTVLATVPIHFPLPGPTLLTFPTPPKNIHTFLVQARWRLLNFLACPASVLSHYFAPFPYPDFPCLALVSPHFPFPRPRIPSLPASPHTLQRVNAIVTQPRKGRGGEGDRRLHNIHIILVHFVLKSI